MVSRMFWTLRLLGGFPSECLQEILIAKDTCLDPDMDQILITTISNVNNSFGDESMFPLEAQRT